MQSFDDLPRSTQIRRIRRLAEIALAAYDLEVEPASGAKAALRVTNQVGVLRDFLKR
jgi:hypothetical protein